VIVYGDRAERAATADALAAAAREADRLAAGELDAATALVVRFGALEAGLVDALAPEVDELVPAGLALREVAMVVGRAHRATARASRSGAAGDARAAARAAGDRAARALRAIDRSAWPPAVTLKTAESFAYYALDPELAADAAEQLARARSAGDRVVVVGIRSIGAPLSAVVAAELEDGGLEVETITVRPRGHPFDRRVSFGATLEAWIAARAAATFVVVDEGPGLSGSSFCGTAAALGALGVPDDRIVLAPSWDPDPASFVAEAARARWPRHRKILGRFEVAVLPRLGQGLRDVGAGGWRSVVLGDRRPCPALQPAHERRKFLAGDVPRERTLLKFVGLGPQGAAVRDRAAWLGDGGFAPPPGEVRHGYLHTPFVAGMPLRPIDADAAFVARASGYVAAIAREQRTGEPERVDDLLPMIEAAAVEALEARRGEAASRVERLRAEVEAHEKVAVDGRMLAHEWIRTPRGDLQKTDGADHHRDHFAPQCRDPVWDLVGCAIEMRLSAAAVAALREGYERSAGERIAAGRWAFHVVAYLAWRVGYATLAASTVGEGSDRRGLERARRRYLASFRRALEELAP
jgi:hypothetical protein